MLDIYWKEGPFLNIYFDLGLGSLPPPTFRGYCGIPWSFVTRPKKPIPV